MRRSLAAACLVLAAALPGCSGDPEPVRLGFIGGLSGRVADLGEAGRNGALLAVEELNAAGGVGGRPLQLISEDDGQDDAKAVQAVRRLAGQRVEALIGPMTSSIAAAIQPEIERAGLLTVSPTVTASVLGGRDDLLFKVAPSVKDYTQLQVAHDVKQGARRVAVVYDLSNKTFTADWARQYGQALKELGGAVVGEFSFTAGDGPSYDAALRELAALKADTLLIIAGAVDTVRLLQGARNLGLQQRVTTSSWSGTEALIELGGHSVEGLTTVQLFDRSDGSARYVEFAERYRERFKQEPGFASVSAYDATQALVLALRRRGAGVSLKQSLLESGPYEGLQERWNFDRHGDAQRKVRVTRVVDGRFQVVD